MCRCLLASSSNLIGPWYECRNYNHKLKFFFTLSYPPQKRMRKCLHIPAGIKLPPSSCFCGGDSRFDIYRRTSCFFQRANSCSSLIKGSYRRSLQGPESIPNSPGRMRGYRYNWKTLFRFLGIFPYMIANGKLLVLGLARFCSTQTIGIVYSISFRLGTQLIRIASISQSHTRTDIHSKRHH